MAFLLPDDYAPYIRNQSLDTILEGPALESPILQAAEAAAMSQVTDYLFERYDTDTIFSAEGDDRHPYLVKCLLNVTLYGLYERLPKRQVPEIIAKNYAETLTYLERIADGKMRANLPRREDPGTGQPKTNFRWGSLPKRSH